MKQDSDNKNDTIDRRRYYLQRKDLKIAQHYPSTYCTRMRTFISSQAQKIIDGQTDKTSYRADFGNL